MCFNISIAKKKKKLEERFDAKFEPETLFEPEYFLSAFTHPKVPVITNKDPHTIQSFNWGLIPHWTRDEKQASSISTKTFNARIETASVKPSFRDALKTKRCLVLADGFFEWQTEGSLKTPHYIYKEDNEPFAFAGLWSEWVNRQTGEIQKTFSILTQDANPFMTEIHNTKRRQPLILSRGAEGVWLSTPDVKSISEDGFRTKLQAHKISKSFRTLGNTQEVIARV